MHPAPLIPNRQGRELPAERDGVKWEVTNQAADQVINTQAGQTIVGVIVYFVTGDGNEGSIFVPNSVYPNTATVREMVHKQAVIVDRTGRLVS